MFETGFVVLLLRMSGYLSGLLLSPSPFLLYRKVVITDAGALLPVFTRVLQFKLRFSYLCGTIFTHRAVSLKTVLKASQSLVFQMDFI